MPDKDWRDEVRMEELPDNLKRYAEIIGVANTIKLAEEQGGLAMYMPKPDVINALIRDRRIRAEDTGDNHDRLARKYKLTRRWIDEICKGGSVDSRQMDAFKQSAPPP